LLAREGPRAVTHRAVAAEAGTSLRATTYYFASRDALLTEALRHYAASALTRFDAIRAPTEIAFEDPIEAAADLLALTVISDVVDAHAGLVAEYEMVLEISRRPMLEATYAAFQAKLEVMLGGYAAMLGSTTPELDARIVLATLRGLEIEALSRPSTPPSREDLREVFLHLLRSIAHRRGVLEQERAE
jgi:DNA-binding transcriptional regulator YbjK